MDKSKTMLRLSNGDFVPADSVKCFSVWDDYIDCGHNSRDRIHLYYGVVVFEIGTFRVTGVYTKKENAEDELNSYVGEYFGYDSVSFPKYK